MNPDWHRPVANRANDCVVVAGNYYGYRQFLLRELLRRSVPLALHGARIPRWGLAELRAVHSGRYLAREEKSKVFGEGLACLNSTSFAEGDSLNCRAFEIAGAGGLQMIEYKSIIDSCFEPGKELLVFASMNELLGHIELARNHPQEAQAIRDAGMRRTHAHHTYRQRLDRILELVAAT